MRTIGRITATLLAALLAVPATAQTGAHESDYYVLDELTPPEGAVIEVGGLDFLPDGRLVVSTRRGQVWIVENPLAEDPAQARFSLFAEGLHDCLGLAVVDGEIHVVQRGELSRLRDVDGDGRADHVDTISNDWGVSGNYHEFAFGLPRDDAGNFYVSLNVSFFSPKWWHGKSPVPYRGWVLRVAPDGATTPVASGFRSPCGVGRNLEGDIFITDNQGDWVPSCPIYHLQDGRFYGHPASLDWTRGYEDAGRKATDTDPPERKRAPAAVWLPYAWSRSTGNLVAADAGGRFGPFDGQLLVAEMTNGLVMRVQLEKVRGEYQGTAFMFRRHAGSAVRLAFAPDGTLFVGRTNRGWGGQSPANGIGRLRYTGRAVMEMKTVHLIPSGFEITFTLPLAKGRDPVPADVKLEQYDYNYWWEYGSPEQRTRAVPVEGLEVSDDRRRLTVRAPRLRAGKVARLILSGITAEDGTPLLHREACYTVNQLVAGPVFPNHVAKLVPPPTPKEKWEEGWLMLTGGNAMPDWTGEGWKTVTWPKEEIVLSPDDERQLVVRERKPPEDEKKPPSDNTMFLSPGTGATEIANRFEAGALEFWADVLLPKGGDASIYFGGRHEIKIKDTEAGADPALDQWGAIGPSEGWPGKAPNFNDYRKPGEWRGLLVIFRPPLFRDGKKIMNARFSRVRIDDVLLHENVELPGPSLGAPREGEAAVGPIIIRVHKGPFAFKNLRFRARGAPIDDEGWEPLFNGTDLQGWKTSDGGAWKVEDGVIVGSGRTSHLFSPRGDYRDIELRSWLKINDGGNSGLYFRTTFGPGWPAGYEAQVNSTFPSDPVKTGSLYHHQKISTTLIPPDVWFKQQVTCRDVAEGVRITIELNDVVVSDFIDRERRHAAGHVALQQHHEGSEVRCREVSVREIEE